MSLINNMGAKMKITELCPDTKYSRSDWVNHYIICESGIGVFRNKYNKNYIFSYQDMRSDWHLFKDEKECNCEQVNIKALKEQIIFLEGTLATVKDALFNSKSNQNILSNMVCKKNKEIE